ncbi:MAG: response regulator [Heliobacteriaceae bacterium]|nr:response regulator [Heliobacteriaceae bacterium]MDD4588537.1 response regulator [Heliobacteriaceae bacterium]
MAGVLIVDDAAFVRAVLKKIISQGGYEVVGEAGDGEQAIEQYQACRPDIVTMDITMPNLNGIEALKRIRQLDPQARIIMCSAMGQESFVKESILAGARDFIVKPFQPEKVLKTIAKHMG